MKNKYIIVAEGSIFGEIGDIVELHTYKGIEIVSSTSQSTIDLEDAPWLAKKLGVNYAYPISFYFVYREIEIGCMDYFNIITSKSMQL